MKDNIIKCPLTGIENGCYITPINEKLYVYNSLITGYTSSDLWRDDDFNFESFEETLPLLYVDLKLKDHDGRYWYPGVINQQEKGMVFISGTNKDNWEWCGVKSIEIQEEEKEKYKNPDGSFNKYKSDPSTMKNFGKDGFVDALEYIGLL